MATARALVLTHNGSEGPGHLTTWLPEGGLELDLLQPWAGDEVPERVTDHAALVVMGGSQTAYDDASAPWLRATKQLMRAAVADGVPVFGVCLGAQLLAEATGGRVVRGEAGPELGAGLVAKRDVAGNDPLFWDLPLSPVVVQWHWDVVRDLPTGSTLLFSGTRYPHQAFRVGERAWGIQFHIETPADMLTGWAAADADVLRVEGFDPDELLARALPELDDVVEVWSEVVRRFARYAVKIAAGPDAGVEL